MNKAELIKKVSNETSYTQGNIAEIIDVVFTEIIDAVASGERVALDSFGIFNTKTKKGREGEIKVKGGEAKPWKTEDTTVVTFKPSKNFAEIVAE